MNETFIFACVLFSAATRSALQGFTTTVLFSYLFEWICRSRMKSVIFLSFPDHIFLKKKERKKKINGLSVNSMFLFLRHITKKNHQRGDETAEALDKDSELQKGVTVPLLPCVVLLDEKRCCCCCCVGSGRWFESFRVPRLRLRYT